jgi:hypothetical protein
MTAAIATKTPWHLWAVGVFGILWNGFGAYDYFMSMTQGEAYFRELGMTDADVAYYDAMPAWMIAVWAIGVWGGVLGAVLLLMRNKLALPVFIASLVAFSVSVIYSVFVNPAPHYGPGMMAMHAVIFAGCVFFVWYSMRAKKQGLLR